MIALTSNPSSADIDLPTPDPSQPITIEAHSGMTWQQGTYQVWVLGGDCRFTQGRTTARAINAVVWVDRGEAFSNEPHRIIAYFEGNVVVDQSPATGWQSANEKKTEGPKRLTDKTYLMRLTSQAMPDIRVGQISGAPAQMPEIYSRGMDRRNPLAQNAVRRTQYTQPISQPGVVQPRFGQALPSGMRRISINSRSAVDFQTDYRPDQNLVIITAGVNVVVEGMKSPWGTIDVSADRVVIWNPGWQGSGDQAQQFQSEDVPLELYMEGNIIFRQGERTIYANRMYYDVRNQVGIVLDAEILTPVPKYEGMLRLQTQTLHQTGEDRFFAENSFVTSSRMGKPGYRLQMTDLYFEDIQRPLVNPFTGQAELDPETGQPFLEHQRLATGRNGFIFLGDIPVFYWPYMATDLDDPTFYIRGLQYKNDRIFGNQIISTWNVYQLLGVKKQPQGTRWDLSLDWLSKRGFGAGSDFTYQRDGFLTIPGPTAGLISFWGIHDTGVDNLGRERRSVVPETDNRYRMLWKHRQMLVGDYRLTAEVGKISDRDFLEQYFRNEWDLQKNESTGIELKRRYDNISWSVTADYNLNNFFTETDWLPRLDHFWLGQPLISDAFTWFEHSSIAYGKMRRLDAPTTEQDRRVFSYLPWELDRGGERLVTRQELDWPLQLGAVKTVPYALGELAHWGEDLYGNDMQRFYWQAGLRASMPMWKVDRTVENTLWNVHGIAHKVIFDVDFSVAESNRNMYDLPLYDDIDDDSIEAFRRMMPYHTFGMTPLSPGDPIPTIAVPGRFDPRQYALRTGMPGWVTSPSSEIADDMIAMRMGMRHRWQTKRGVPGRRHITDWIVLDTNATWFPNEMRDNFGKSVGLVDYDFRWHVGDRLTLLSSGLFDFFDEGQQLINVGGYLTRPPRGSLYMGLRLLEGPIENQVLLLSYTYRMSPKWVTTFSTSYDLGKYGNLGQNFSIMRVGESLLISLGFRVNPSSDDVGVMFAIEPRFMTTGLLKGAAGARIPPAGLYGLE
ncbi:MAG: LPS-assembly protein LptD [Pirellulales bacterium]|nr:LPS-assembly protein LptD [Pirellulales bacterium]